MYELVQASAHCYYIQSPAKIGVVDLGGGTACLIDSGGDKDAGKKALRHLEAKGWRLTAIYNTHSHADHIGGNKYLCAQTGCAVYAPGIEADFTCHPVLEPSFLYGGYPCKELRHKFLLAQESPSQPLTAGCLPQGLELIPLPGHSFDMVGFRSSEGVAYLADCLSSRETLDKYGIGFVYDVGAYLETLKKVKSMEAALFIPSHAGVTEDIAPLAQYNIDKVWEAAERIRMICREPLCFEEILRQIFGSYGLAMNFQQYALVGSTVRSYLAWMKDSGQITAEFADNRLLWRQM